MKVVLKTVLTDIEMQLATAEMDEQPGHLGFVIEIRLKLGSPERAWDRRKGANGVAEVEHGAEPPVGHPQSGVGHRITLRVQAHREHPQP